MFGDRDQAEIEEEALVLARRRPVASRKKNSVKLDLPINSAARSRPRTLTRSGRAAEIAVVAAPRLPIIMDVLPLARVPPAAAL